MYTMKTDDSHTIPRSLCFNTRTVPEGWMTHNEKNSNTYCSLRLQSSSNFARCLWWFLSYSHSFVCCFVVVVFLLIVGHARVCACAIWKNMISQYQYMLYMIRILVNFFFHKYIQLMNKLFRIVFASSSPGKRWLNCRDSIDLQSVYYLPTNFHTFQVV